MSQTRDFTKYEIARILGARALQIAMNAPLLIKITDADLERIKFDSLKIAEVELESGVLPISIKKPFPLKKEGKLKRVASLDRVSEEKLKELEEEEEGDISSEGEIMALVNSEEELDESTEEAMNEEE